MSRLEELQKELAEAKEELYSLEIDESDFEQEYRDMLDELYPDQVGGLLASRILEECDPIAYNCGLTDFCRSIRHKRNGEIQRTARRN